MITYSNEALDSYKTQINCEAGIYVNKEIVGICQYVLFNNELTISHIFIKPEWRRKGYGSRLIKYVKEENKNFKYKPSLKTDLGALFKHKEDIKLTENKTYMRARTVNESLGDYPIGAEFDSRAPWNEKDSDIITTVELNKYGDVSISKTNEETEETHFSIVDPNLLDELLAKKMSINSNSIEEGITIEDISQEDDNEYIFKTDYGTTRVSLDELEELI